MDPKRCQNSGVVSQTPFSPISPQYAKQRSRRDLDFLGLHDIKSMPARWELGFIFVWGCWG